MSQTRRLAAIMFTDIVGYTTMMQQNEAEGMAKAKRFRTTMQNMVSQYRGEVLEIRGDGSLSVFNSAVDAVKCAKEIQETLRGEVPLRVGIHLGDIVQNEDHIFGDAVNIASRIESMGIAGAVLVSSNVRNQIKNKPEFALTSLGRFTFKNVEEDMSVYALANEGFAIPQPKHMQGKGKAVNDHQSKDSKTVVRGFILGFIGILLALGIVFTVSWLNKESTQKPINENPSIVVLPFDNLGSDTDKAYFASGVADEIRMVLSSIEDLKVISRTSSIYFKDHPASSDEIATTLGVKHILSGSLVRLGNDFSVNIELSNTQTDKVEWTMKSDRKPLEEIFEVQQEIAEEVAKKLQVSIRYENLAYSFRPLIDDPKVYDLFLEVFNQYDNFDQQISASSIKKTHKLLQLAPDFAPAYKMLADRYLFMGLMGEDHNFVRAKVDSLYNIANTLDPDNLLMPGIYAFYAFWYQWDFEKAENISLKGVSFKDENSILLLMEYYQKIGDLDKGFMWLERSFEARDIEMTWLKMDPVFKPVKNDPRYLEMLERVGFP